MTAKGFRPATSAFFCEALVICEAALEVHNDRLQQQALLSTLLPAESLSEVRSISAGSSRVAQTRGMNKDLQRKSVEDATKRFLKGRRYTR